MTAAPVQSACWIPTLGVAKMTTSTLEKSIGNSPTGWKAKKVTLLGFAAPKIDGSYPATRSAPGSE
jgi:hypothetical protein